MQTGLVTSTRDEMETGGSTLVRELLAGGLGGMAGVITGHPLDTIRIQLQQPRCPASGAPTVCGLFRHLVTSEGPQALFKGLLSPLATASVQNAVTFVSKSFCQRVLSDPSSDAPLSYSKVWLAGAAAGSVQSVLMTPVELIKIRLQLQAATPHPLFAVSSLHPHPRATGPSSVVQKTMRTEGWRGLYRGFGLTLLRDAPSYGVYFATNEFARELLSPGSRTHGESSLTTQLVAGGIAGVMCWTSIYPVDVIKSRMQAQDSSRLKYSSSLDCLRQSIQAEGHAFLWRGLGVTLTRAFVVNGAIFVAYEKARGLLSGL